MQEDLLMPLKGLPNGVRIHPAEFAIFDEGKLTYWPVWDQVDGIVYNTSVLPDDQAPRSYHDLVDPRFKSKMAMVLPGARITPFVEVTLQDPRFGPDYHRQLLAQDMLLTRSGPDYEAALARGERALGPGAPSTPQRQPGAPLKWKAMEEGVFRSVFAVGILKQAPAPNAAKVFLNWLLSPQFQTDVATKLLDTPATIGITHPMGVSFENLKVFGSGSGRQRPDGNPEVQKLAESIYGRG